jgi:hypothetical protein
VAEEVELGVEVEGEEEEDSRALDAQRRWGLLWLDRREVLLLHIWQIEGREGDVLCGVVAKARRVEVSQAR